MNRYQDHICHDTFDILLSSYCFYAQKEFFQIQNKSLLHGIKAVFLKFALQAFPECTNFIYYARNVRNKAHKLCRL